MMAAVARAIMVLATHCLGEYRREWAAAMRAEFAMAVEEGRPLVFATGCLLAALRYMPTQEQGRFALANYALALCLMVPMAALQIGCAVLGFPYLFTGHAGLQGIVIPGSIQAILAAGAYQAAVPAFTLVMLCLGFGQLRLAWTMLDRNWSQVTIYAMRALAAAVTLVTFMGALFLDATQALLQVAVVVVELAAVCVLARWHAQLPPLAEPQTPAF